MTNLLEEIKRINRKAASELEKAGFCTNSDIKTLTRYDLNELLPGRENLKMRKKVYDIIHKSPIHAVLKELKSYIPDESLRDALSGNGAFLDYLHILKELKSEVNHIQEFFDAHIELLEKISQSQDRSPDKDRAAVTSENHSSAAASAMSARTTVTHNNLNLHSQQPQASTDIPFHSYQVTQNTSRPQQPQATVTYKMVVRGNTLDRHVELLQQLKGPSPATVFLHLQETMHYEESQVIIVFCPVVSCVGTDAEAVLLGVSSDKPIILVMMHRSRTANSCQPPGPYNNVVLVVNVFFHETVQGLLKCHQNDKAISAIQQKLLEYSTKKSRAASLYTPFHGYQVTQNTSRPQQPQATVTYKMVVRGNTLDRHVDLLQQLKGPGPATVFLHLQETMRYEESQVLIVFCPVVSCVGTDAESVLSDISSDKPIILVMMHHSRTANSCQPPGQYDNVVLVVNVFFHETVQGLLKCHQNDEAISAIQQKLLVYSTKTGKK